MDEGPYYYAFLFVSMHTIKTPEDEVAFILRESLILQGCNMLAEFTDLLVIRLPNGW